MLNKLRKLLIRVLQGADHRLYHEPGELYFECHVTIEPVHAERLESAKAIARVHNFRVADLMMKKREEDTPKRSQFDTFMTGHSRDYRILEGRMIRLIQDLHNAGFKVWRYKIEDTLIDSRSKGILSLHWAVHK